MDAAPQQALGVEALTQVCSINECIQCHRCAAPCARRYAAAHQCTGAHVCRFCVGIIRDLMTACGDAQLEEYQQCPHENASLRRCRTCCLGAQVQCYHAPLLRNICVACGEALRKEVRHRERIGRQRTPSLVALCVRRVVNDPDLIIEMARTHGVDSPLWQLLNDHFPRRRTVRLQHTKYKVLAKAFHKLY